MQIIITGSNGIIGQQLLIQLLDAYPNANFVVINRKLPNLIENRRVKTIELDLLNTNEFQIETLFNKIKSDFFFHLAWETGHRNYLDTIDNLKWEKVTISLINSFYQSGGKRFVGIGSSLEYDWSFDNPFKENSSPVNGNNCLYGQSKLNVFKYLQSQFNISYLWGRIFFVFGPGQSKTRLIPLVISNVLNGSNPLSINGLLKRDYISTFEIAKQIIMMQKTNYSGPINICSGRAIKLNDIIKIVEYYAQKKLSLSPITFNDKFEIESVSGSIDLINKYYPNYSYSYENFQMDLFKTITELK